MIKFHSSMSQHQIEAIIRQARIERSQALGRMLRAALPTLLRRVARAGGRLAENRVAIAFVALFVVSGLTVAPGRVAAQDTGNVVILPNEQLKFKAPLAGLPQTAILYGDPTKPGLYVARVKFPVGVKVMPHTHTDAVRTVLIMSGTMYFGIGEQWDESKLKVYPAGTFFTEPANTPHFAWAKDGEVIAHLTSVGPTGTTFIPQKK